jgi:NAD(P)H-hydrate epimerase
VSAPSAALPTALYRANQVRELDRIAIEELGIPGATLMARAGNAAMDVLAQRWPRAPRVSVVCGLGNNAGDGFVVARLAAAAGYRVRVGLLGDAARLRGDALGAYQQMKADGIGDEAYAGGMLEDAEVIVDAIFGTGLDRAVTGAFAEAIAQINGSDAAVLALDIPSGLHADTGCALGACVAADVTVTFIGLKQGLFTGEARNYCGQIVFDDLAVPGALYERVAVDARRVDMGSLAGVLGPRSRVANKGRYGHVLVIGGETGFAGAARLAGEGAARSGAGLTSIATREAHAGILCVQRPELMCHGVESPAALSPLLARATVLAVGPGLGRDQWGRAMLAAALACEQPAVLDADALNLLAEMPDTAAGQVRILTPHPGEAGRLLGSSTKAVEDDRFAAARALVERYRAVVVLKGAGTIVADGAGPPWVCDGGNPGMASGGMGDVLTGIIAALLAQGLEPSVAARAGACLHAATADAAAVEGERGMLAGDLLAHLRSLANTL